jgi:hypothetical protein
MILCSYCSFPQMPFSRIAAHRHMAVGRAVLASVVALRVLPANNRAATGQTDQQIVEQLAVQAEVAPQTLPFKILGNTVTTDASISGTASNPNVAIPTTDADVQATATCIAANRHNRRVPRRVGVSSRPQCAGGSRAHVPHIRARSDGTRVHTAGSTPLTHLRCRLMVRR